MTALQAPFPYFGGKRRAAALVWQRFGRVANYVEPFFGSGAVLFGCPEPGHTETVNDADALLCNFWRATQADPEAVARWADWPVNETDLHARHRYLRDRREAVTALLVDPDAYDAKAAGWWVWGISQWIGSGWCPPPSVPDVRQLPHVGNAGRGVHRVAARPSGMPQHLPHLGGGGGGIGRGITTATIADYQLPAQVPYLRGDSKLEAKTGGLYAYFEALADRLRRVRVCCGDWSRVLGDSVTWRHGMTAVFLDPPYSLDERQGGLYAHDSNVAADVCAWAIANGDHPQLRIALCGYAGEHVMPDGWTSVAWKAHGGYGSQGAGRGRDNANREIIWFNRSCVGTIADLPLFAQA